VPPPAQSKVQVDRVEGADASGVTQRVEKWVKQAAPGSAAGASSASASSSSSSASLPKSLQELDKELDRLVNAAPVMVFIKGTPDEPRCKFSRQLVELLRGLEGGGCAFGSFDILTSEAVRQGLKDKFNWPTFPQLYVNGKLVGGIDIANELNEAGELVQLLPKPPASATAGSSSSSASSASEAARARTREVISSQPVVLLMKGTVEDAACGFSERMVELLTGANVDFRAVDVLADPALREAAKALSGFSTFPQLYIRGELLGGVEAVTRVGEANPGKPLADALGAPTKEPLEARLLRLVNSAPAILFMKGTAAEPRCGFSARAVDALRTGGLDVSNASLFASFDILRDAEVREGLKKFSNWPTFPQLYVEGKLIGGLDILNELNAEGELRELLEGLKPRGGAA
jgi:Grx4 family monothiol glutaredoxin